MAEAGARVLPNPDDILRTVFGFDAFRGHQSEIIHHIVAGGDALALMPTGAGKSLCYQIPALCRAGTALVISPLVALMRAQVADLKARGIQAAALHSQMTPEETRTVFEHLHAGTLDLLYVAPERAGTPSFLDQIEGTFLSLIAVDEAHCISQWGHDFRPAYQTLGALLTRHSEAPRLALTGTADHRTTEDIRRHLWLTDAPVFRSGFARPNIALAITGSAALNHSRKEFASGSSIVYCRSRAKVDRVAKQLRGKGVDAHAYHAGLDPQERAAIEKRFQSGSPITVAATIAFGMGMDRGDVRQVVHLDTPSSIEAYWQEVGRAGRDGAPARAVLSYQVSDAITLRRQADHAARNGPPGLLARIEAMLDYCETPQCRTRTVLAHFGEFDAPACGTCDRCRSPVPCGDHTADISHLIETLNMSGPMGPKRLTTALGSDGQAPMWTSLIRQSLARGLLMPAATVTSALIPSTLGLSFLAAPYPFEAVRDWIDVSEKPFRAAPECTDGSSPRLFDELQRVRTQLADEQGLPAMMIAHDKALKTMAEARPQDLNALESLPGVGAARAARYGEAFLKVLQV